MLASYIKTQEDKSSNDSQLIHTKNIDINAVFKNIKEELPQSITKAFKEAQDTGGIKEYKKLGTLLLSLAQEIKNEKLMSWSKQFLQHNDNLEIDETYTMLNELEKAIT